MGRLPRRGRTLIETCVVGLAAGLAAVAFQAGIDALGSLIYNEAHWSSLWAFAIGSLGIICGAALLTGFLLNKLCPEAAGSGIPQLKLAFWKDFGDSHPGFDCRRIAGGFQAGEAGCGRCGIGRCLGGCIQRSTRGRGLRP